MTKVQTWFREPRAGLDRQGSQQREEEMGEVESGPAVGLASRGGGVFPQSQTQGLRVLSCFALSGGPSVAGSCWVTVGKGFGAGGAQAVTHEGCCGVSRSGVTWPPMAGKAR